MDSQRSLPEMPLLDHGYVKLVGYYGSDEGVVEAARMSTGSGFRGWGTPDKPGDERFLRRLWLGKKDDGSPLPPMPLHSSPFEQADLAFEVQAPIVVFREWHRHRTQSYNEMSGRYTVLPDLYYVPSLDRTMKGKQSKANKQGSEAGFDREEAQEFRSELEAAYGLSRKTYEGMVEKDVARELSRLCIPVAQYSRMRAKANLLNWLKFLTLRMAPEAQWEIRQYANVIGEIVSALFPRTWALYSEGMQVRVHHAQQTELLQEAIRLLRLVNQEWRAGGQPLVSREGALQHDVRALLDKVGE